MPESAEPALRAAAEAAIRRMRGIGADYYELHMMAGAASYYLYQDGVLERLSASRFEGAGMRCFRNGRWFMASVDAIDEREVCRLADELAAADVGGAGGMAVDFATLPPGTRASAVFRPEIPPEKVPPADKIALLLEMAGALETAGNGKIRNHRLHYSDAGGTRLVAASDGTLVVSGGSRVRLGCSVVARDGDKAQHWSEQVAGPGGFEIVRNADIRELAPKSARKALELLAAPAPPAGKTPVILDPSAAGLFVHECLGHSAEADEALEGHSLLAGKLGNTVASRIVSIADDPTLPAGYGRYLFDSEGTPARKTYIIRYGVLEEYLHSKETALRMNARPNGHGRHSSYGARPLPRMSNTYIEPGASSLEAMLSAVNNGLLLCRGGAGYVLSEKGEYTCKVLTGYVVSNGKVAEQVGETAFNGEVLDTLLRIEALGSDLVVNDPALCSKEGQEVPVDAGGPHVLIGEVLVAG